ncbi:MAG: reverse transcriptase domain-containing protein [Bacteroidia bacterium]
MWFIWYKYQIIRGAQEFGRRLYSEKEVGNRFKYFRILTVMGGLFMAKKKDWYQPKGYLHITPRLNWGTDRERLTELIKNPKWVERHAFFPLLHKKIFQRRYKIIGSDSLTGKTIRGHSTKDSNGKTKPSKKPRPIHYATHIDSQIYSYYTKNILQPKYESLLNADFELNNSIIAYRQIPIEGSLGHKGNIHFAKEVFDQIRKRTNCVAMAFDIENFFSSLNHRKLKLAWAALLGHKSLPKDHYNLYKSITKFSYIDISQFRKKHSGFDEKRLSEIRKKGIHSFFESVEEFRTLIHEGKIRIQKNQYKNKKTKKLQGIPQGLTISALLANIYLLEFDRLIVEKVVKDWGGMYRRYSDDIVIIGPLERADDIKFLVFEAIKKSGLVISEEKTEICRFEKNSKGYLDCYGSLGPRSERKNMPFCYLGFEFDGKNVLIKAKNLSKFYRRMKESVKSKARQIENVQRKTPNESHTIYYRKLYRTYTMKGAKKKILSGTSSILKYDHLKGEYYLASHITKRKYWGNTLGYAKRASEIMGEESIIRQFRNHRKILKKTMSKHLPLGRSNMH